MTLISYFGNRTIFLLIVFERQVRDNHAINSTCLTILTEAFESVLHDWIQVTHEHQWNPDVFTDIFQLAHQQFQRHTVSEGFGGRILDDGTVCHRVTERDSDFYHIDAFLFQGPDNIGSSVQDRCSGTKIQGEDRCFLFVE